MIFHGNHDSTQKPWRKDRRNKLPGHLSTLRGVGEPGDYEPLGQNTPAAFRARLMEKSIGRTLWIQLSVACGSCRHQGYHTSAHKSLTRMKGIIPFAANFFASCYTFHLTSNLLNWNLIVTDNKNTIKSIDQSQRKKARRYGAWPPVFRIPQCYT
jgi:hypothetical protein